VIFQKGKKPPIEWYKSSRESIFRLLEISTSDTVLIGASIMQFSEWHEFLPNESIKNRAIASSTSDNVVKLLPEIITSNPKAIIVMVGLNDLIRHKSVESIVENYHSLIHKVRFNTDSTNLYILSITPVRQEFFKIRNINSLIEELNKRIKISCHIPKCTYIDVHPIFLDLSGQLDQKYTFDGIHLNGTAYKIIAEKLKSKL
jgi:lysophospholipase L1-like esterase